MPYHPFVPAAPMRDAAVEVFTVCGYLTGKGAIPRPTLIYDVESAPQVTRQAKLRRRRGPEVSVTDDRFLACDTRVCVDIVIGLDDPARKNVAAGKIRPLTRIERVTKFDVPLNAVR